MLKGRRDWLSITPEPERELPRAIATLRAGGKPAPEAVERERRRAERLVLHGGRRRWLAWLRQAEELARRGGAGGEDRSGELEAARSHALAVIDNHDALMLGLPGRVASGPGATARAQEEKGR